MVEYYAPWCAHCKKLAPVYSEVGKRLKEKGSKAAVAKLDATKHTKIAQRVGVDGYPTLIWYNKGDQTLYQGERNEEALLDFILDESKSHVRMSTDLAEAKQFAESNRLCMVFWGDEKDTHYENYYSSAAFNKDIAHLAYGDAAIKKAEGIPNKVKISLYRNFDTKRIDYTGEYVLADINTFLLDYRVPLVPVYDGDISKRVFGDKTQSAFLYFHDGEFKDEEAFRKVAWDLRRKYIFSEVNVKTDMGKRTLKNFIEKAPKLPFIGYVHVQKKEAYRYLFSGDINAAAFQKFVGEVEDKKVKKIVKSEPLPTDNDFKAVKTLTGETFEDFIFNDFEHNIFVLVYTTWSKNIKQIRQEYAELASKHKNN
mmetsp:Transcript_1182/g.1082  ORF Transcript_1182/g.1082 Transcript_1182/m.1082 type:complete len:368 (-) Transcript_1182:251-1354(-)